MKEITGRDNQIICQALQVAIPIMLKYSLSSSNTFDMLCILEERGNQVPLKLMDTYVRNLLEKILEDIKNGKTLATERNSDYMKTVTAMYFSEENVKSYLRKAY